MKKLPVVAAIPAYNAEASLHPLLQDVLDEEYDAVYVLDDASTDNTLEVAYAFSDDVVILEGRENLGSAGNRNRIIPELGYSALIHFLDADIRLNTQNATDAVRELGSIGNLGFVSGLVRLADGTQNPWNYGPDFSLPQIISATVYSGIYKLGQTNPAAAKKLRKVLDRWPLIEQWPHTLESPAARDVFWGTEANMVIPSEVFRSLGGYDPSLRYHEVMELAKRMEKVGLRRRFDPTLDVTHESFDLLNNGPSLEFYDAQIKIIRKMGIAKFVLPRLFESKL